VKNLESEGAVFGNSEGVGKWDRKQVQTNFEKNTAHKDGEQRSQEDIARYVNWKNTIKNVPTSKYSDNDPFKPISTYLATGAFGGSRPKTPY